jgi:hypothetical protein
MAYKSSESDQGADLYYFNVTSMLSIMKTSVYLVETLASDLFIVRPSKTVQCSRKIPIFCLPSCIGAMLSGTQIFLSSFSQCFFISLMQVCFHDSPGVGTYSTVTVSRYRNRRSLHLVAPHAKAEPRVQSRTRANHKLVLLLHSRSELCLHWYVLSSFIRLHDSYFLHIRTYCLPNLADTTPDTRCRDGANLSHVSIIVIESGALKTFFYSARSTRCPHALVPATGAIYLTVLACNVAAFVLKSNMFNIFLDMVSYPLPPPS